MTADLSVSTYNYNLHVQVSLSGKNPITYGRRPWWVLVQVEVGMRKDLNRGAQDIAREIRNDQRIHYIAGDVSVYYV